jgi:hypothetical protein
MWARIDDALPDHPKIARAGPLAAWLYVAGLCYSARFLTDGLIPASQVRRLADVDNAVKLAAKLVEVGLWENADDGYLIHDYGSYNPTRERALADKARAKERMDRWRGNAEQTGDERRTNVVASREQTALRTADETENERHSFTRPVPVPVSVPVSRSKSRPRPIANAREVDPELIAALNGDTHE